ncbi:hypothetical protein CDAR_281301 [Caerostris darwini]|uniref:Uncharacterized protein n=1 Tax=Caerostris darwini TaxID=1538125 RepID=A0AAV4WX47_9ARAC|nr:hypothetical protein CDAR_281301 [Caerostris darwini]
MDFLLDELKAKLSVDPSFFPPLRRHAILPRVKSYMAILQKTTIRGPTPDDNNSRGGLLSTPPDDFGMEGGFLSPPLCLARD